MPLVFKQKTKKFVTLLFLLFTFFIGQLKAQTLAEELINQPGGSLNGSSGGFGWDGAWNGAGPIGAWVYNTTPMTYPGFTITQYYGNNLDFNPTGRKIDLETLGNNFEPYTTTTSNINECGTTPIPCKMVGKGTVYLGFLLRKTTNSSESAFINLNVGGYDNPYEQLTTSPNNLSKISFGYFSNSFSGIGDNTLTGARFFGIATHTYGGNNFYSINNTKPITAGGVNFLVLRIQFGSVTTISGFVNPPIAVSEPALADIIVTTTGFMGFRSFSWSNFFGGGTSELDEIRFGGRFQDTYTTNQCNGASNVSFYYGAGTVCKNTGVIYPNFTNSAPGTFFSTASGMLNLNPTTGIITVGPTLSGTYMINYSMPGSGICRDVTIEYPLDITATPNTIFDKNNSVIGSNVCQNDNGSITIKDSQIGIGYELVKVGTLPTFTGIKLSSAVAGDDVIFDIPSSFLGIGLNIFSITGTIKTGIDSTEGRPKRGAVALKSVSPVILDGVLTETGWNFRNLLLKKFDPNSSPLFNTSVNDIRFGALWDNNYLYVGIEFIDPTFTVTGDALELYLYGNSSVNRNYVSSGWQGDAPPIRFNTATQFIIPNSNTLGTPLPISVFPMNRDPATPFPVGTHDMKSEPRYATNTVVGVFGTTATGRSFEFRIAWTTLGLNLASDMVFLTCSGIAFDLAKNDNTPIDGSRMAQYLWNGDQNNYQFTNKWGTIQLTVNSDTTEYLNSTTVVTVNALSVGGTISGTNRICYNTSSNLTLSGYLGSISWSYANSISGPWFTVAGTSATLNTGPLTSNRYFQATVTQPTCNPALSTIFLVSVDGLSVAGNIIGDNIPKCNNGNSSLTLSGFIGTISGWASSLDNTTFNNIGNVGVSIVGVSNLTNLGLNFYRSIVKNGVCPSVTTTSYVVTVTSPSITGYSLSHVTNCGFTDGSVVISSSGSIISTEFSITGVTWQLSNTFNSRPSGTYTGYIRNVGGTCLSTGAIFVVTIPSFPTIAGTNVTHITNCGVTDGAVTINGIGINGALQYSINGSTWFGGNVFSLLNIGTYTPYIRNQSSVACSTMGANFTITIPGVPSVLGVNVTHITNCGLTNGVVTINGVGGTGTLEYRITGSSWQSSNIFSSLNIGTYTTYVRNQGSIACSNTGVSFTITIPGIPSISGATLTHISNCGLTDGTATLIATGGTGTLEYSINGSTWQTPNLFSSLSATTRIPFIRNQSSIACSSTGASFTITIPGIPSVSGTSVTHVTNCGLADGSVNISPTGGTGTLEYSINGSVWQTSNLFSGLNASTRTPYIRNQNSIACSSTGIAFTITIPGYPTLGGINLKHISGCGLSDGAITVTSVNGGISPFEYKVDGSSFQSGNSFASLGTGGHTLYIRNSSSIACSTSGIGFIITAPGVPAISGNIKNNVSNCGLTDGSVTLTGTSGNPPYEFSIDGGATWQSSNVFTGLAANSYIPFIRNQFSPLCTATGALITINLPPNPTITGVSIPACSNINTIITASGAATYSWIPFPVSQSGNQATVNPSVTTIYTITGISSLNCTSTGTVTVNVTSAPIAGAISGASSICTNGSTTLSLNGSSGTVQWQKSTDNGNTWSDIIGATSTILGTTGALPNTTFFRVIVSQGPVCNLVTTSSAVVTVSACAISANITSSSNTVCLSSSNVSFSGIGTTVGTITGYIWDFGSGAFPSTLNILTNSTTSGIHSVTYSTFGSKTINLTVTGAGGEIATTTYAIQVDDISSFGSISINGNNPACYNTSLGVALGSATGNIQWLQSNDNITYTTIAGANTLNYAISNIIQNTYYKVEVKNGVCPVTTSGFTVVSVIGQSIGGTTTFTHDGCIGTIATLTVSGFTGTITDWEHSTPNNTSYASLGLNSVVINRNISQNSEYYRAVIVNGTGCFPAYAEVQINSIPCGLTASFTGYGISVCQSTASSTGVTFNDVSQSVSLGPVLAWQWDFDGGIATNGNNTSVPGAVTWSTAGTKNIRLTITGFSGVTDSETQQITIDAFPNPGNYTITGSNAICLGQSFTLTTTGETASGYVWIKSSQSNFSVFSTLIGASLTLTPSAAGIEYYRLYVSNNSCTNIVGGDTYGKPDISITITSQPYAIVDYFGNNIYCKGSPAATNPVVFIQGYSLGSYSSPTLGTSLNNVSGSVDINTVPEGIHTITYSIPAVGGCLSTTTSDVITITSQPVFNVDYTDKSFCKAYTGTTAGLVNVSLSPTSVTGTFSASPLGLAINSSSGQITPKNSLVNSYTITFTPNVPASCTVIPRTISGTFDIRPTPTIGGFNYGIETFCGIETLVGPNLIASTTLYGSYSYSSLYNLSINGTTGIVNPSKSIIPVNSFAGFTITYTINEPMCDAVSSSTGLRLNYNPPKPFFSYDTLPFCSNSIIKPKTLSGLGAIFSTSESTITLDPNTGEIKNVPFKFNGTVSLIYQVSNVIGCAVSSTAGVITITAAPIAEAISYEDTLFCNENVIRASGAFQNGNFKYISQSILTTENRYTKLAINSISGLIDLANSENGKYLVYYEVPKTGGCSTKASNYWPISIISSIGGQANSDVTSLGSCENQDILINLNRYVGSVVGWQYASVSNSLAGWNNLTNIKKLPEANQWVTSIQGEDFYLIRARVKNRSCSVNVSTTIYFKNNALSKGGIAIPMEKTICIKPSTEIKLRNYNGKIVWQQSQDSTFDDSKWQSLYDVPVADDSVLVTPEQYVYSTYNYYRAVAKNGVCKASSSNIVRINKCDINDFIPNALTPNSGDQNSYWDFEKLRLKDDARIIIYNRYGIEVYKATGYQIRYSPWDGSNLPAGTYYYYIDSRDSRPVKTGAVTIVK
ncbi:MAG: gliding motility-associated C-terminal domain-containing protein [Bacteroidota bacterium]|nr:gliding motility-associated C-terminal domain-containing protein [Bacteroidota bacterium]